MSTEQSAASRTEVGPLQAAAVGPDQTAVPTRYPSVTQRSGDVPLNRNPGVFARELHERYLARGRPDYNLTSVGTERDRSYRAV